MSIKINRKASKIVKEVKTICSQLFGDKLHDIYLYGSYARGDYDKESDIDILLTVNLTQKQIIKYRKHIAVICSDLSLKYDITVSISIQPLNLFIKFSQDLPFYRNVIKEGIHSYGN